MATPTAGPFCCYGWRWRSQLWGQRQHSTSALPCSWVPTWFCRTGPPTGILATYLNDHATGLLSGAIPAAFLHAHSYSQCSECNKILHSRFRGTCHRCRPNRRARESMEILSARPAFADPLSVSAPLASATGASFPDLGAVHERYVPTIRHIPKELRRQCSQCLARTVARAVWANDTRSWAELKMLAKCVLCTPARAGKNHQNQRLAWTRGRLSRWAAGDRAELWHDIPTYKRQVPKICRKTPPNRSNKTAAFKCAAKVATGTLVMLWAYPLLCITPKAYSNNWGKKTPSSSR